MQVIFREVSLAFVYLRLSFLDIAHPDLESTKDKKEVSNTKVPNKDMAQKTKYKIKYKKFSNKSMFFI